MPNGQIVWTGTSRIGSNAPILLVATWKTNNPKTGNMVQFWIVPKHQNPVEAIKQGSDASVCGDCKHKGVNGARRSCYVNPMGPYQVGHACERGVYPTWTNRPVWPTSIPYRFGAWGDPAAVPFEVWESVINTQQRKAWTGYTHAWKYCDQRLKSLVMASTDTPEEYRRARAMGWRAFQVVPRKASRLIPQGSILCPNSSKGIQCADCLLCNGTRSNGKSITIAVHGRGAKHFGG